MKSSDGLPILSAPSARTLSYYIADRLRQAILTNQLKPGQRLVEQEIAEAMETSRGPVRDALKLLENEGVVISYPRRGTFVAKLSVSDVEEIYTLREALEAVALEYAIRRATSEQIDELDRVIQEMTELLKQEPTQSELADIDIEFHRILCRISGHQRVTGAWEALSSQIRMLVWSHGNIALGEFRETVVEHHRILAGAVRRRDIDQARAVIHEHLRQSFQPAADSLGGNRQERPVLERSRPAGLLSELKTV